MKRAFALPLVALLAAALVACGADEPVSATSQSLPQVPADALVKPSENGPVKATVSVWPAEPSMLDLIHLQVEMTTAPGTTATLHLETELLTAFWQDTWQQTEKQAADGSVTKTKVAGLYAEYAGKQRIPSFRITYVDAQGAQRELLTEEVALTIAPPPEGAAKASMQPPLGVLDPARGAWPVWLWIVIGAMAACAAWLVWRTYRGMQAARERQTKISAYDYARGRLQTLRAQGAPDGKDAAVLDAWYVELSAIVRRYIEQRFGLRAPELTTEEFLHVAKTAAALSPGDRNKLVAFLAACDRVKFAGYRPNADESLVNFALAEEFVETTAPTSAEVTP